MTEAEFREVMRDNGWTEENIQDDVDTYNEMKSAGLNPIPYEETVKRLGKIDRYPCEYTNKDT